MRRILFQLIPLRQHCSFRQSIAKRRFPFCGNPQRRKNLAQHNINLDGSYWLPWPVAIRSTDLERWLWNRASTYLEDQSAFFKPTQDEAHRLRTLTCLALQVKICSFESLIYRLSQEFKIRRWSKKQIWKWALEDHFLVRSSRNSSRAIAIA